MIRIATIASSALATGDRTALLEPATRLDNDDNLAECPLD